jgi:hypothetical protein
MNGFNPGIEVRCNLQPNLPRNRIPVGSYQATIRQDGPLGWRIELQHVAGWENVQIHVGNFPGQTRGCVLVGTDTKTATNPNTGKTMCSVTGSQDALARIRAAMQRTATGDKRTEAISIRVVVQE